MSDNVWAAGSRPSTVGAGGGLAVGLGVSMWLTGMCTSELETLAFASRQMSRWFWTVQSIWQWSAFALGCLELGLGVLAVAAGVTASHGRKRLLRDAARACQVYEVFATAVVLALPFVFWFLLPTSGAQMHPMDHEHVQMVLIGAGLWHLALRVPVALVRVGAWSRLAG